MIAEDIDHFLGISVLVDEKKSEFYECFETLGIRHATIINLNSQRITAQLLHPELLYELTIKGAISSACFSYFIDNCENISSLTINFTKPIFKNKPTFFPQQVNCLPFIKSIKIVAHTKSTKDLNYVCDNVTAFIKNISKKTQMKRLHLTTSHKSPSPYLDQMALEIFMLAFKNHATLQELVIIAKEYSATGGGNEEEGGQQGENSGSARRGTEMVGKKSIVPVKSTSSRSQITAYKSDQKNSDRMEAIEGFLTGRRWPAFKSLKVVVIITNSNMFVYAQEMLTMVKGVKHLSLEISGGVVINCWLCFETIIQSTSRTLTSIKLSNISYEDYMQNALDIDFGIFRPCKSLKQLHLSCLKREMDKLPMARNLTSLPKSIEELEIFWLTLSVWQWFRLLFKYRQMESLTVAYISRTERSFGWLLKVLRWLIRMKLTKLQILRLTDFKIKFRNKRSEIKRLRNAVPIQIEYMDFNETLLVVDRGQLRRHDQSIPSIASQT